MARPREGTAGSTKGHPFRRYGDPTLSPAQQVVGSSREVCTGCSSRACNYRENQSDSKAQASAVVNRACDGRLNRAAASRPSVVPAMTSASVAPTPTGVSWVPTA